MIPQLKDKTGNTLIGNLSSAIECLVTEERNGLFELTMVYPINYDVYASLTKGNIIVADANDTLKAQQFRIYMTRKMMSNKIEVYARHISFDLAYDFIEGLTITNQSCQYALSQIFAKSQFSTGYTAVSNIVNTNSMSLSRVNCLEAIGGIQGSILDTFGTGAEILRNNKTISVLNARGVNNSVTIEYKKNLTGFELEEDDSDLVTRIYPFATYTDTNNNEITVTVPAKFVDSPLINNYSHQYIKQYDYSDKFEDGVIPTASDLITLANKEFSVNKVDLVKQNFKIEFIPLSKCAGYEGLEDKISLCDTVTIIDTRYGINTPAKVIKATYNTLRNKYESMELGEPRTTLGDVIGGGGGENTQGPAGPQGPQGPPGADGNVGDFPNSLPAVPVLSTQVYGFGSIELNWTYENKVYYDYELYASKTNNFTPNTFDLVFKGKASTFLFEATPGDTWYFRACAVNSHGGRTAFSSQVTVTTQKVTDLSNYVSNMAIGDALIGTLSLDRGWVGTLKGNWIDAKQLSVTDGNGKRTLWIDSFGNVQLDVTALKISSSAVATESYATNIGTSVVNNLQPQIDGKIDTWSQDTDPSTAWTTTELKTAHSGDLWYKPSTKETFRYSGTAWVKLENKEALEASTLAQTKAKVFTATPTIPYYIGDLWVQGTTGDIMRCSVTRTTGSYTASEWVKASKYTDDTTVTNFINNTYSADLLATQNRIDGKVDSYYQTTQPYPNYTNVADNTTYNKYVGDIWYNSTATEKKTYIYTKTANGSNFNYQWQQQEIPKDMFDVIDGKKSIYTSKPTKYAKDDLWILESSSAHTAGTTGQILTATTTSTTYNASHWIKKVSYTDDTYAKSVESSLTQTASNIRAEFTTLHNGGYSKGVTTINETGVTVEHTATNTKATLSSEGVQIINKGDSTVQAWFGKDDNAFIGSLNANRVYASNVPRLNLDTLTSYYVTPEGAGNMSGSDLNNATNSIQGVIDKLRDNQQFSFLGEQNKTINIYVQDGTYSGTVDIRGLIGIEDLTINCSANVIILGGLTIADNSMTIRVQGNIANNNTYPRPRIRFNTNGETVVRIVRNPGAVLINGFTIEGDGVGGSGSTGIYIRDSRALITSCDVTRVNTGIFATHGAVVSSWNNRGGTSSGFAIQNGAVVYRAGTQIIGSGADIISNGGIRYDSTHEAVSGLASGFNAPTLTSKTITQTFSASKYYSTRNYTEDNVFNQGAWDDGYSYGWWTGHASFGSQVSNFCNGGTGITMQVYLQRKNTSHGVASAVNVYLNGNVVGTLTRGEGKWFTVPSAVINTLKTGGEILCYFGGTANYIKYETNCKLKVTVTKTI